MVNFGVHKEQAGLEQAQFTLIPASEAKMVAACLFRSIGGGLLT